MCEGTGTVTKTNDEEENKSRQVIVTEIMTRKLLGP